MTGLVQKNIIDRNGTATTRWVKPEATAASSARPVPAPVAGAAPPSDETLARFAERAGNFFASLDNLGNYRPDRVAESLRGYSRETLLAIATDLRDSDRDEDRAVDTATWVGHFESDEESLRDLIAFRDVFDEGRDRGFVELAVRHLDQYEFLPKTREYSALTPEQVRGVERVLSTTEAHLGEWYDEQEESYADIVLPEPLARLVYDRPEDHGRINALVAGGIDDAARIEFILDSGVPSLSEGAL